MRRLRTRLRTVTVGSSRFPTDGSPTLILDFVPTAGLDGVTLELMFTDDLSQYDATGSLNLDFVNNQQQVAATFTPTYSSYTPDPTVQSGITNIQVWS